MIITSKNNEFGAGELEEDEIDNHVFAVNAVYQYVDLIKLLSSHTSSMIEQGLVVNISVS
jgi:hypothetical protein